MKAQKTLHRLRPNHVFRFVEGFRLNRESRQIRKKNLKIPILLDACATCSELPSYISTMIGALLISCLPKH